MTACTLGRPMAGASRSSLAETASIASIQLTLTGSTRSDSPELLRSIRNGGSDSRAVQPGAACHRAARCASGSSMASHFHPCQRSRQAAQQLPNLVAVLSTSLDSNAAAELQLVDASDHCMHRGDTAHVHDRRAMHAQELRTAGEPPVWTGGRSDPPAVVVGQPERTVRQNTADTDPAGRYD